MVVVKVLIGSIEVRDGNLPGCGGLIVLAYGVTYLNHKLECHLFHVMVRSQAAAIQNCVS